MKFILDTCAISEAIAKRRNPGFESWVAGVDHDDLAVAVQTVFECMHGIYMLPVGKRRDAILALTEGSLAGMTVMDFTYRSADMTARIMASEARQGRALKLNDAAIAAIALIGGRTLVTRDSDFDGIARHEEFQELRIVNPWSGAGA